MSFVRTGSDREIRSFPIPETQISPANPNESPGAAPRVVIRQLGRKVTAPELGRPDFVPSPVAVSVGPVRRVVHTPVAQGARGFPVGPMVTRPVSVIRIGGQTLAMNSALDALADALAGALPDAFAALALHQIFQHFTFTHL
eukprot:Skav221222  [mRNA]  locus=scaffold2467:262913:263475:- [translate_table: standard]